MKRTSIVVLLLALTLIAAAPVTVTQGEEVVLTADTGSASRYDTVTAEFSIPRTDINHFITRADPNSPIIRQPVEFDLRPGEYELRIRTWVNNELTSYETIPITVLPRPPRVTARTTEEAAEERDPIIHIDPIPDVTPGTTFIVPVLVTGNGEYTVEIPRLTFATYEVPDPIILNGTQTIPVLLHIDEEAEAGTYAVPIRIGDEQATARLRIIRYQEEASLWWILIPIGLILVVAGLLLLASRNRGPKAPQRLEPVPPPPKDDKELITYY